MRQSRICLRPESPVEASVAESGVSAPLGREGPPGTSTGGRVASWLGRIWSSRVGDGRE